MSEGKASLVKLTTRLQEDDGLPVTGLKSHRLYAARRAVEAEHHLVYAEKFAALPRYLHDVCMKSPFSWQDIKTNQHNGEFMAAFLAFGPAVELIKTLGRNVSGADFGHSTNKVYLIPLLKLNQNPNPHHYSNLRFSKGPMPLECTKQAVGLSFPFGRLVLGANGAMNLVNLGSIAATALLKQVLAHYILLGTLTLQIGTKGHISLASPYRE